MTTTKHIACPLRRSALSLTLVSLFATACSGGGGDSAAAGSGTGPTQTLYIALESGQLMALGPNAMGVSLEIQSGEVRITGDSVSLELTATGGDGIFVASPVEMRAEGTTTAIRGQVHDSGSPPEFANLTAGLELRSNGDMLELRLTGTLESEGLGAEQFGGQLFGRPTTGAGNSGTDSGTDSGRFRYTGPRMAMVHDVLRRAVDEDPAITITFDELVVPQHSGITTAVPCQRDAQVLAFIRYCWGAEMNYRIPQGSPEGAAEQLGLAMQALGNAVSLCSAAPLPFELGNCATSYWTCGLLQSYQ